MHTGMCDNGRRPPSKIRVKLPFSAGIKGNDSPSRQTGGKSDSHNLFAFRKILSVEALETLPVSTKPKTSHCLEESGARWAFADVCSTLKG